jgi:TolA-binding protein
MAIAQNFIDINPSSPYAEDFTFGKGNMFYSGRKYRDAIAEYEVFAEKYPDSKKNAEGLYWMQKSYISLNEPEKAKLTFGRLHKNYPDSEFTPIGMLELGLMHLQLNDVLTADSVFNALQDTYPESAGAAQAGFERALIKYSLGDTIAALELFRMVAEKYPGQEYADQSRWRIAMHLRSKELNDSARSEFKLLASGPNNSDIAAEAQYRLGELYFRDGMYDKAIEEFLKFKDRFSSFDEWYLLTLLNMGESYEKLENYTAARDVYQSLQALNPDSDYGKTAKRRLKRLPE